MKVRIRIRIVIVTLVALFLAACNKEDPSTQETYGGRGSVELKLVGEGSSRVSSIEEDNPSESTISSITIYVFDKIGNLVEEYKGENGNTHKFIVPKTDESMQFLVAVNAGIPDEDKGLSGSTYNRVRSSLSGALTLDNTNSRNGHVANEYAMGGWRKGVAIKGASQETDGDGDLVTPVSIEVKRLISKLYAPNVSQPLELDISKEKLENLVPDEDVVDIEAKEVRLTDYVVINGINRSDAFYTWNSAGDWSDYSNHNKWTDWRTAGKSWWKSKFNADGFYSEPPYGGSTSEDNGYFIEIPATPSESVVYVYENKPQDHPEDPNNLGMYDNFYDKDKVYSYIIKGTIDITRTDSKGVTLEESYERYWRVNLLGDNSHHIRRNGIYEIQITKVSGIGYGTPEDAEKEEVAKDGYGTVVATMKVLPWDLDVSGTNL